MRHPSKIPRLVIGLLCSPSYGNATDSSPSIQRKTLNSEEANLCISILSSLAAGRDARPQTGKNRKTGIDWKEL